MCSRDATVMAAFERRGLDTREIVAVDDTTTGEINYFAVSDHTREHYQIFTHQQARANAYALLKIVSLILLELVHPRGSGKKWPTTFCLRAVIAHAPWIATLLSRKHLKTFFKNLQRCASVWLCSHCSRKISQRREQEIKLAMDAHTAAGGFAYMWTFTFSHNRFDDLELLLGSQKNKNGLAATLQYLRYSWCYKALTVDVGLKGFISTKEITTSPKNGWHPHVHELWLVNRQLTAKELKTFKSQMFAMWLHSCKKSGLGLPNRAHGVDVTIAMSPEAYLAKFGRDQIWGSAAEMTKWGLKQGSEGKGLTFFDLVRLSASESPLASWARQSVKQYATATYGKRQTVWSRGLKKAFGIKELTDAQIAEQEDDTADLINLTRVDDWDNLVRLKRPYDVRAKIQNLAESGGREAVQAFIAEALEWTPEQKAEFEKWHEKSEVKWHKQEREAAAWRAEKAANSERYQEHKRIQARIRKDKADAKAHKRDMEKLAEAKQREREAEILKRREREAEFKNWYAQAKEASNAKASTPPAQDFATPADEQVEYQVEYPEYSAFEDCDVFLFDGEDMDAVIMRRLYAANPQIFSSSEFG